MSENKNKLRIFTVILLLFIVFGGKTIFASEYTVSENIKITETFTYEYENQELKYYIVQLPTDTQPGLVTVSGAIDKANLTGELHIPTSVTYKGYSFTTYGIGIDAFRNCIGISSVNIPSGITYINQDAFAYCTSLTDVIMTDDVAWIGYNTFCGCTQLTHIRLSNQIKHFGDYTFYNCRSLESITLPDALTTIEDNAFTNCIKLQTLNLPSSLSTIGTDAFIGTQIKYSVYPDSYAYQYCKTKAFPCTFVTDTIGSDIALKDIVIKQRFPYMNLDQTITLDIIYYPMNTTIDRAAIWTSSDPSVAKVSVEGTVTVISAGRTFITAKLGQTVSVCTLTVNPDAPKTVKAKPTGLNSSIITWERVQGANGYTIYRSTSKEGSYSEVMTVYATSFADRTLSKNQTYYYKVFAGGYEGHGNYSTIVSVTPQIAIPQVKAFPVEGNHIKLHWESVYGASGFYVYRATSKAGPYNYYKKVTNTYLLDTKVTKGKTYYYYVKSYYNNNNTKIYSDNSVSVNALAKTPPTPKYVTLGTNRSNVYKILGRPIESYYNWDSNVLELYYSEFPYPYQTYHNTTALYLKKIDNVYQVIGWTNRQPGIKLSDGDETNTGTFTLGSTMQEVNRAMVTPYNYETEYGGTIYGIILRCTGVEYGGGSSITYNKEGKVIGWVNKGVLKIRYGNGKPTHKRLTLGSTVTEVLEANGVPDVLRTDLHDLTYYMKYGDTVLYFNMQQKLIRWENKGKMNLWFGDKLETSETIKIGSSLADVINVKGTPDSLQSNESFPGNIIHMTYGNISYQFDNSQKVSMIYNH